ncbi:MAG: PAS domain-containing protein [Campylobacterota bacterium]|nr:PAS domain-containing protein [Campylobacterota bacterium]
MRPVPTGKEIKISPNTMIVSKTNEKGIITYGNSNFVEISGYKETELIGSPHNILRHPDMPRAIFYFMWESIRKGRNITAVVKNLAKNGDHYWVTTDFDINRDQDLRVKNYIAFRQVAPKNVLKEIEPLYAKMLTIHAEQVQVKPLG